MANTNVRHIAGIPEADTQRCVRCCEVISQRKSGGKPHWPGSYLVVVGNQTFVNHPGAADCVGVDVEKPDYDMSTEVA
jgi:hypothetical protein